MRLRCLVAIAALSLSACRGPAPASQVISSPAPATAADIVYVTPTNAPTLVPTMRRVAATITPAIAPAVDSAAADNPAPATCEQALTQLYTVASERCLGAPANRFCNGASPLESEPGDSPLNEPGALAAPDSLRLMSLAPLDAGSGGLVWLRLEETLLLNALLLGDIQVKDSSSSDSGLPRWSSVIISSGENAATCQGIAPFGVMVAQSVYGRTARLAINGVSAAINGTLVALTQGPQTRFIALEGKVTLLALGHSHSLYAGEQLDLAYAPGDWTRPAEAPGTPRLMNYDLVEHLPVALFSRPLPIPQPGYAQDARRS